MLGSILRADPQHRFAGVYQPWHAVSDSSTVQVKLQRLRWCHSKAVVLRQALPVVQLVVVCYQAKGCPMEVTGP